MSQYFRYNILHVELHGSHGQDLLFKSLELKEADAAAPLSAHHLLGGWSFVRIQMQVVGISIGTKASLVIVFPYPVRSPTRSLLITWIPWLPKDHVTCIGIRSFVGNLERAN